MYGGEENMKDLIESEGCKKCWWKFIAIHS
jgi:hypothetical protein